MSSHYSGSRNTWNIKFCVGWHCGMMNCWLNKQAKNVKKHNKRLQHEEEEWKVFAQWRARRTCNTSAVRSTNESWKAACEDDALISEGETREITKRRLSERQNEPTAKLFFPCTHCTVKECKTWNSVLKLLILLEFH